MNYPRPCGCKGGRTCLVCEKEFNIKAQSFIHEYKVNILMTFHFKSKNNLASRLCFFEK